MTAGDLRFYRNSGGLVDTIIATTTGPFVHVDVDMGDGTVIGELSSGLQRYTPSVRPALVAVYPTAQHTSDATLTAALVWAVAQLSAGEHAGRPPEYGWADILSAALHRIDAHAVYLGDAGEWDCSDFATRFALRAGLVLAWTDPTAGDSPRLVTPTQLAAALGIE